VKVFLNTLNPGHSRPNVILGATQLASEVVSTEL